jgi:hypothetical protein
LALVAALVGLFLVVPTASAAEPTRASVFRLSGSTSQGGQVRISVSNRLTRVERFSIAWRAPCATGRTFSDSPTYGPLRIRGLRSGLSFSGIATSTEPLPDGFRGTVQDTLSGRLTRSGARGTWRSAVTVRGPDGQPVDTCNTGTITWRARVR